MNFDTVFHVSDNNIWQKALNNINNYLLDIGETSAQIEVVANANAVSGYFNTDLIAKMHQLNKKGVRFFACKNALKAHNLEISLLPSFIDTVPAGITALVIKQQEGYAYIKP